MPKISVIVPIYNTEKYLEKCLISLINQTLQEIEIILVNDGSTDYSEEVAKKIIHEHPDKDIKYFKKENGGLSDARNFGVKQATGEYISFIDSDDFIEKDLYQRLEKYRKQGIDLIKFKMTTLDEKGDIIQILRGPVFDTCIGEEAFEKLCTKDKFLEVACIYLYRKEFFIQNQFQYEVGTYHEDFGLTPYLIIKAKTVVSTENYGYYYLQRENSITSNENANKEEKKAYDVLQHYDNAIQRIEKESVSNQTKMLFKRYYTNTLLLKAERLKGKPLERYLAEVKKRKVYQNIKVQNGKQLLKKILLRINIKLYLKMR